MEKIATQEICLQSENGDQIFSGEVIKNNFFPRKFDNQQFDTAINTLIYGSILTKYCRNAKFKHQCLFYILENDLSCLQWLSKRKQHTASRLSLTTINNIREKPFFAQINKLQEDYKFLLCLLLDKNQELILSFPNNVAKFHFWQGLQYFVIKSISCKAIGNPFKNISLKQLGNQNDFGQLQFSCEDTRKVLQKLQIFVNDDQLNFKFNEIDINEIGYINQFELKELVQSFMVKEELKPIFNKYKRNEQEGMTLEDFKRFSREEQKQSLDDQDYDRLVKQFMEKDEKQNKTINFLTFQSIVFSQYNTIFNPLKQQVYQDMDRPMADYYICASQSLYKSQNSHKVQSISLKFTELLNRGCRYIELDIFDNDGNEPIVNQEAPKVFFEDIIKSISTNGFKVNVYPIILALEINCSVQTQEKAAEILQNNLKDRLFIMPNNYYKYKGFPTPNELKGKVILKCEGQITNVVINYSKKANQYNINEIVDMEIMLEHDTLNRDDYADEKTIMVSQHQIQNNKLLKTTNHEQKVNSLAQTKTLYNQSSLGSIPSLYSLEESKEYKNKKSQIKSEISSFEYRNSSQSPDSNRIRSHSKNAATTTNNHRNTHSSKSPLPHVELPFKQDSIDYIQNSPDPSPSFSSTYNLQKYKKMNSIYNKNQQQRQINSNQQFSTQTVDLCMSNNNNENQRSYSCLDNKIQFDNNDASEFLADDEIIYKPQSQLHTIRSISKKVISPKIENLLAMFTRQFDFERSLSIWEVSQMSENQINDIFDDQAKKLIDFNKSHFTKVLTKHSKIFASKTNLDPLTSFMAGSQIITINHNICDLNLLIYNAKFSQNGRSKCGYVLKPSFMLKDTSFPLYPEDFQRPRMWLKIEFLSGQKLFNPFQNNNIMQPQIIVFLRGLPIDENECKPVEFEILENNNQYNPIFSNFNIEYTIRCPQHAYLIIKIIDKGLLDETIQGQYAIPVTCIRSGYRVIQLMDQQFKVIQDSYLFSHVAIEDLVYNRAEEDDA